MTEKYIMTFMGGVDIIARVDFSKLEENEEDRKYAENKRLRKVKKELPKMLKKIINIPQ